MSLIQTQSYAFHGGPADNRVIALESRYSYFAGCWQPTVEVHRIAEVKGFNNVIHSYRAMYFRSPVGSPFFVFVHESVSDRDALDWITSLI